MPKFRFRRPGCVR